MLLQLNLQFFAGEKTEKATPKKKQDSRKKGQVAKSQDLNTAVSLLVLFGFLTFFATSMGTNIFHMFQHSIQYYMLMDVTEANLKTIVFEVMEQCFYILAPFMLAAVAAGVIANYAQVGWLITTEPITPKLEKIDPIKGFKRIFSMRAIVELLKSILKIGFVGTAAFIVLWLNIDEVLKMALKPIEDTLPLVGTLTVQMGLVAAAALLVLGVLDYFYQKFDFEKSLRMSKQDIKDEHKNSEGDPLIKSRIRQTQREMAMRRMMQEVPNADVVITNPTHYAIALKYDESKRDAPYVVAKGTDYIAQKIKLVAKEHDIMTVENRPLARALHDQADIGDSVPEEFFKAIAEILAYVYRIKNKV
ncbi:flagellar biosynthesis protein FlhB [Domibacillus enclensis]|uniref:Flagellar biosynthetic protein FlhB n=1 Tax=Domibacillus enclensis TaxID=1017273 RepID=A0A1N6UMF9_9BACI|nr:flagellar biosynthesis protein FlhB [Domibacillus enclensis]OXS78564.1 EscU/YscU/HrcU family type III secretion system export apparatus switch protein [Domibacillus enclensis]SIQ66651.1 flagellar biosynthetic protein FlhB [Domibacillus enclensis]